MVSLDLCPINEGNIDVAIAMLDRGFPEQSRAFWAAGLQRILTMHDAARHPPIGYLMKVKNETAGIVLTIPSQRASDAGIINVVHLAAWYIDEQYRWLAARMMKKVVAAANTVFFDLTPNAAAQAINRRLGFDLSNEGFLIYLLPITAFRVGGTTEILSFARAAPDLSPCERTMLEHHQELGCIVGASRFGDRLSPVVFAPMRRRGLPGARLIRARSKALVIENLGAISRFLLRRQKFFLRMDATRQDPVTGSFASRWTEPTFVKGHLGGAEVDLTYSEFVFLGT